MTKVEAPAVGGGLQEVERYSLDEQGNRTASHLTMLSLTNASNRLTEDDDHIFGYDLNGNLTIKIVKATGQVWRYSYNIYDEMTEASLRADVVTNSSLVRVRYQYDALGRRVVSDATDLRSGFSQRFVDFLHDGWNVVTENEVSDLLPLTWTRRVWYTHGVGLDDLLALTEWDATAAATDPDTADPGHGIALHPHGSPRLRPRPER